MEFPIDVEAASRRIEGVVEKIAFNTSHVLSLLRDRLIGWVDAAFLPGASVDALLPIDPAGFLSTPGLWIGLALAAVFLAAAVRLRRYREPI